MTKKTPSVKSTEPSTSKQIKLVSDLDLKKKKRSGEEELELAKVDEQAVSPTQATEAAAAGTPAAPAEGGASPAGGSGEAGVVSGQSGVSGAAAVSSTFGSYGLIGGGALATVVGLAGGGGAASFIPGLPTVVSKAIQVVDGPLAGAAIYYDTNGNGVADGAPGSSGTEFLGFTNSNGVLNVEYTPVPGARFIVVPIGPDGLPAIDTYTGLPFGVELAAEDNGMSGSQVVSPVSTLLASGAVSEEQLRTLLGVDSNVDLSTFNFAADLRENGAAASDNAKRLAGNAIALGNVLEAVNAALDPGVSDIERSEAVRLASSIVAGVIASIDPGLEPRPSTAEIYGLATQFAVAAVRVDGATVSINGQPAVDLQTLLDSNTLLNPSNTFTFDAAVNEFVQLIGERIEASSQAVVDRIVNATQADLDSIVNNDGSQQNTNNFLEQLEEQAAADLAEAVTQDAAGTLGLLPDAIGDLGTAAELPANATGNQLLGSFAKGNLLNNDVLFRNPGENAPEGANLKIVRVNGTEVQAATLAPELETSTSFYLTTSDFIGQTLTDAAILQTLTGVTGSAALDSLVATHPEFVGFDGFDSMAEGSHVDATSGSAVYFDVTVSEGGNITFSFDFTTSDYLPYEDFTFITLTNLVDGQPDANSARIAAFSEVSDVKGPELFTDVCIYVSLSDVLQQSGALAEGELPSIDVSQVFGIQPGTLAAGTYRLGVGVTDAVDTIVNSLMTVRDVTVLDAAGVPTSVTNGVIVGNGSTEQTSELVTTSIQGTLVATTYGVLVVAADGDYVYQVDETLPTVQALRAGQQVTDTFTYTVSNGSGTDTASLTITVTGTNDNPVAVADTASAVENGPVVTGSVASNDTDVDRGDTRTFALNTPVSGLTLNADGSFSFNPNASSVGDTLGAGQIRTLSANYTVTDAAGATAMSTLTISITGVNDAPVIVQATSLGNVNEGAALITRNLNGDVTDVDLNDTLTFSLAAGSTLPAGFTLGSNGVLIFNADDPAYESLVTGQTQALSFNYTATDSAGASVTNSVSVTVVGNDSTAPVAFNDLGKANDEQTAPVIIDPVANDEDADAGDVLTFSLVEDNPLFPTDGFSINAATGKLEFDMSAFDFSFLAVGETLIIPVLYTVTDSAGLSDVGTAKVFIRGTDSAPEIVDQTIEVGAVYQGSVRSGFLPAFDPEFENSVTFTLLDPENAPAGLILNPDGSYSYSTSGDAYAGRTADFVESVVYQVSDGTNTSTGTLTFNTFINNQNPVAVDDINSAGTNQLDSDGNFLSGSVSGNLLFNDTDRESTSLTAFSVTSFSNATFQQSFTGTLGDGDENSANTVPGFSNTADRFALPTLMAGETYSLLTRTVGISDTTLAVFDQNGNLVDVDDDGGPGLDALISFVAQPDTQYFVHVGEFLDGQSGDWQVDFYQGLITEQEAAAAGSGQIIGDFGTLFLQSSGFYTYQVDTSNQNVLALAEGETLQEVIEYEVRDEDGGTDIGTLTITITGSEDGPVVDNFNSINVTEGAITTIDLNTYFTDPEGLPMTFELVQGPFGASISGSTLTISGAVPQYDYLGQNFTDFGGFSSGLRIVATDAAGNSSFGLINVNAIGINDAPVANNDSGFLVARNGSTFISESDLLANDTDADEATTFENLRIQAIDNVQGGTATLSGGVIEITPSSGSSSVTFTYTVADNSGAVSSAPATASFTVFDGVVTVAEFMQQLQSNPSGFYRIEDTQAVLSNPQTVQSLIAELDNIQGVFAIGESGGTANFSVTAEQYLTPGFTDLALKTENATLTVFGATSNNLAQIYNDGIATTVIASDASVFLPASAVTDSETGFRSGLVAFATSDTGTVDVNLGDMAGNTAAFARSVSPAADFPDLATLFNPNTPVEGTYTSVGVAGNVNVTATNAGQVAATSLSDVNFNLATTLEEPGLGGGFNFVPNPSVAFVGGGFTIEYSEDLSESTGFSEVYSANFMAADDVTIDFGERAGNAGVNANSLVLTGGDVAVSTFNTVNFEGITSSPIGFGRVFISHSGASSQEFSSSEQNDGISGTYTEDTSRSAADSSSITLGDSLVDARVWANSIDFIVGDAAPASSTFTAGSGTQPGPFDSSFGGFAAHVVRLNGSQSYIEESNVQFNSTTGKFDSAALSSTTMFNAAASISASIGDGVGQVIMRADSINADIGEGTFNGFNEVVLRGDQVNTESIEILQSIDRTGDLVGSTGSAEVQAFRGETTTTRQGAGNQVGSSPLIDGQFDVTATVANNNDTFIDARSADVTLTGATGLLEVRGGSTRSFTVELETDNLGSQLENRLLTTDSQVSDFQSGDTLRRYLETRTNTASSRVDVTQTANFTGFGQILRLNTMVSTIALGDVFGEAASNQILVFGNETRTTSNVESVIYDEFDFPEASSSNFSVTELIDSAAETNIAVGDGSRQIRVVADSIDITIGNDTFTASNGHIRAGGNFERTQTNESVSDSVNEIFTSKFTDNNTVLAADSANITLGDGLTQVRVAAMAIDVKTGDQLGGFFNPNVGFDNAAGRITLTGTSTQNIEGETDFSSGQSRASAFEFFESANTVSLTGNPDTSDGQIDGSALVITAGNTVNIELGSGIARGFAVTSLRQEQLQAEQFENDFVEGFEVLSGSTITRTLERPFESEASTAQSNQFSLDADLSALTASFTEQSTVTAAAGSSFNLVGLDGSFIIEAAADQLTVDLGDAFIERAIFDPFGEELVSFFEEGFRDILLSGGFEDSSERYELEAGSTDPVTGNVSDFVSVESTTITAADSIDIRLGFGSSFVGAFADVISIRAESALTGVSQSDGSNIAFLGADSTVDAILFESEEFGFGSEIVSETLRLNFAAAQQVSAQYGDGDSFILASGLNVDVTTGDGEGLIVVGSGFTVNQVSSGDFFEAAETDSQNVTFLAASATARVTAGDLDDSILVNASVWTINAGAGLNTVDLNGNTGTGTLVIDEHTLLRNDHASSIDGDVIDVDYTLVRGFGADDSINTDALGISFEDVVDFTSSTELAFDNLTDVLGAINPGGVETGSLSLFQITDSTGVTGVYAYQADATAGVTATELNLLSILQEVQTATQAA